MTDTTTDLESVLLAALMDEYGGTAEDWTGMRSLRRVVKAVRACCTPPDVTTPDGRPPA